MVASPVAPPGAAETPVLHGAARVAAASRTGSRRAVNQDRWLVQRESGYRPVLLAVADGVGGGASGERASAAAVDALAAAWDAWQPPSPPTRRSVEQRLIAAAQAADAAVRQLATGDGAATTLTAAVPLYPTGLLVHAGDSRAFAARPGDAVARQLTTDHSLAAVAPRAPRHVITRYLGQAGGCVFDAITVSLEADHRLILCTDGASNTLTATRIAECARLESAAGAVAELMAEIEQHDPADDATVVILTPTPCPRDPFHLRPALRPQRTARRPALALGAIGAAAAGTGVLAAGVSALPRAAGKLMAPFRTSPHSTAAEYLAHWEAARFAEMHQLLSGEAQRRIDRDAFVRRYESIASQMTLTQLSTR
ncbi:MAG TPA: protein phosphatase 2C domain-containing protein, partial [Chloroflexota bacterium]|nr:protein phosphatase 2C domain-containing protein [Chloroflexota bacterium]